MFYAGSPFRLSLCVRISRELGERLGCALRADRGATDLDADLLRGRIEPLLQLIALFAQPPAGPASASTSRARSSKRRTAGSGSRAGGRRRVEIAFPRG